MEAPGVQLTACISIVSAAALLLCRNLGPLRLAWLIVGYVVILGLNFTLLPIWMLSDRRGAAKRKLRHLDLLRSSQPQPEFPVHRCEGPIGEIERMESKLTSFSLSTRDR